MQSLSKIIFTKDIGHQWATEPGPLILVGIDTGYGRLHVDPQGVTYVSIPEVTMDLFRILTSRVRFPWSGL